MPFPLHKAPRGLLSLFRLQVSGATPSGFAETVQPTADLTSFYGADLQQGFALSSGLGAFPRTATATANAARFLAIAGEVTIGAAAGTDVVLRIGLRAQTGAGHVPLGCLIVTAPVAGRTYSVNAILPGPLVTNPGTELFATATGNAGGADHECILRTFAENYLLT